MIVFVGTVGWARTTDLLFHSLKRGRHNLRSKIVDTSASGQPSCGARLVSIAIESCRVRPSRFYASAFLLLLPRRFHERIFEPSSRKKPLKTLCSQGLDGWLLGIGFEPMTFRL